MKRVLLLVAALGFMSPAVADQPLHRLSLSHCLSGMNNAAAPEQALRSSGECAADATIGFFLARGTALLTQRGKNIFGQGFHIQQSLDYSVTADGKLRGDLDAVIPLHINAAQTDAALGLPGGALFLQNGVTSWSDEHGFDRNDTRIGLVQRLQMGGQNLLGFSATLQQNLERGHQRHVFGADYVGKWGKGYVNHYAVQSDWLVGRVGYEERAIGGNEIGVQFTPTNAIQLDLSVGDWDSKTEIGASVIRERASIAWQPHPYLQLRGAWQGGNQIDQRRDWRISFIKPLGAQRAKPRWIGFGVAQDATLRDADVWRTVESERRIEVVERKIRTQPGVVRSGDVSVRFLQAKAGSGGVIRIEASVANAVTTPLRVVIQLAPGDGATPAVPGEDFPTAPIEIIIAKDSTAGIAEVDLPFNPDMKTNRKLRVTIIEVGGVS